MANYSAHHRSFLQRLLNKRVLSKSKALQYYWKTMSDAGMEIVKTKITKVDSKEYRYELVENESLEVQHKRVQKFVEEICNKIQKFNLTIKLMTCEATEQKFYVLHVVNENDVVKSAALRTSAKAERDFLRAAIKAVVTSQAGHISDITCLNLTTEMRDLKLTKKEATIVLQQLTSKKWLTMVHGQVYLGPRTMTEMKKYLSEQFEDYFKNCQLCKEITLLGEECPSGCGAKLHRPCLEAYFGSGASQKCVSCKKAWPNLRPRSTPPPGSSPSNQSEADQEEEEMDEGEQNQQPTMEDSDDSSD